MAQSTSKQVVVLAAIVWAALSSSAGAQVADSLQCFKVKDPLKLKGIVDIDGASLGLAPGCKISRAKQYCTAATSSVQTATAQGNPLALLPISGPNPGDRVCYRVRCPSTSANQEISDQFGNRTVEIGSVKTLCVPAVAGPPRASRAAPWVVCVWCRNRRSLPSSFSIATPAATKRAGRS
jgi:hypothetical protein